MALDQRGYGESDKPSRVSSYKIETIAKDVYDFVKAVGKEKCILVGHDWGGAIAWSVASNYAEIVEKVIHMVMMLCRFVQKPRNCNGYSVLHPTARYPQLSTSGSI